MHSNSLQNLKLGSTKKQKCRWCKEERVVANLSRHEESCYLNPKNLKLCPVCNKPIKNFKTGTTCSCGCANTYFRTGTNHPNWKDCAYRTTCFVYHKKKCIICDEDKIVEVHHYDGDSKNNKPENLIPLCPTHHSYWHSRYRTHILDDVNKYAKKFFENLGDVEK